METLEIDYLYVDIYVSNVTAFNGNLVLYGNGFISEDRSPIPKDLTYGLYKLDLSTGECNRIYAGNVRNFYVTNDWVYFSSRETVGQYTDYDNELLHRLNLVSGKIELLSG